MRPTGIPIGSHPIAPRPDGASARLVGSRLPLEYAQATGANFVTSGALDAARARTSFVEPHQSFDHQRLWADLLSSPALAFNLFGDLAGDLDLADRAVHALWPDVPGIVRDVRFAHSPGPLRSGIPEQPPGVRCGFRARPRRRHAGVRRPRRQVPRAGEAGDPEAEQPARGTSRSPRDRTCSCRQPPTRWRESRSSP